MGKFFPFFRHVHATLKVTPSVGWSIGWFFRPSVSHAVQNHTKKLSKPHHCPCPTPGTSQDVPDVPSGTPLIQRCIHQNILHIMHLKYCVHLPFLQFRLPDCGLLLFILTCN